MKTEFKGTRATKLTPRRVRLTPSRFPRKLRGSGAEKSAPAAETATAWSEEQPEKEDGSRRGDSLQLYLREIGRVKLLTPKEEIELAKRIKRGDKEAREQMITANLRLVVKI